MSLKKKLNRLKPHLSVNGNSNKKEEPPTEGSVEIPFLEEWSRAGVEPYYFDQQYCLIREVTYPLSYQHGKYQFRELLNIIKLWNEMDVQHPLSAAGHKPGRIIFL
nr:hypothetical protein [Bacillus sp. T3]